MNGCNTIMKLTQELKDQWIAALKSGKYIQGSSRLRTYTYSGDKFCCLGVLCDVIDSTGWNWHGDDPQYCYFDNKQYGVSHTWLPENIQMELIKMNDSVYNKRSFNEIADWIETNIRVEV